MRRIKDTNKFISDLFTKPSHKEVKNTVLWCLPLNTQFAQFRLLSFFKMYLKTFWVTWTSPRSCVVPSTQQSSTHKRALLYYGYKHQRCGGAMKWRWWMSVRLINNYSFQLSSPSRDFTVEVYMFLTKNWFSVTQEHKSKKEIWHLECLKNSEVERVTHIMQISYPLKYNSFGNDENKYVR